MRQTTKPFRIEQPAAPRENPAADTRHAEILAAIADLKTCLSATIPQPAPEPAREPEAATPVAPNNECFQDELNAIQEAILRTKTELAQLQVGDRGRDIARLTDELKAVVHGTEEATEKVLHAAESIDRNAADLAAAIRDPASAGAASDIQEQVIQIFEACNFQDLTGQRIAKVVATMGFIEERVERMIEIWAGPEGLGAGPVVIDDLEPGDDGLMNGPPLDSDEGHVSQGDIDALFP